MSEHCKLLLCEDVDRSCNGCPHYKEDNPNSLKVRSEIKARKRLEQAAPALLEACEAWKYAIDNSQMSVMDLGSEVLVGDAIEKTKTAVALATK